MGDSKGSKNLKELQSFRALKQSEQRAVVLRYEGKSYPQIAANISDDFAKDVSERTVRDWFVAGGRLEGAYHEFLDAMAAQSFHQAKQTLLRGQDIAAQNMVRKIASGDDRVSLDASKAVLNKFIPDRQVMLEGPAAVDDLPAELSKEGAAIVGEHNPDQPDAGADPNEPASDDARDSASTDPAPGEAPGPTVP